MHLTTTTQKALIRDTGSGLRGRYGKKIAPFDREALTNQLGGVGDMMSVCICVCLNLIRLFQSNHRMFFFSPKCHKGV